MKRGFFIVQFLSFVIVPWKIIASAQTFTSFLSGYGLFMASVVAIMIADYYFPSRSNIAVAWFFDPNKTNERYRYHKGWNLQAVIAYLVGIALPFPGFVANLGASGVGTAGRKLCYLGWLLPFTVFFVMHIVICRFWPMENHRIVKAAEMGWEENIYDQTEGLNADNKK
ncbi:hypothetical protein LZ32DRAFT_664353 [Colletotrichum eremochloae]|nr:hypothetical protein LZ32DRAFT_664353 [Colletotrichum eremochloae]